MIYVISGPSGCGKSTLIERALADFKDIHFSISHTTREEREGEAEGKDYYFVSREKFQKMLQRKEFVEWAVVHGAYYGTSKKELKRKRAEGDLLLDIDVQGAMQVREKIRKAIFIFILPPRYRELKKRLEGRGLDSTANIKKRLARARQEIWSYSRFDYIVINDELEKAVDELESIIICQRLRLAARKKEMKPILASFRRGDAFK
jgi:guanylate kinase